MSIQVVRIQLVAALLLTVGLCVPAAVTTQDDTGEYEYAFSEASPELVSLKKQILAESSTPTTNEWAGRYIADVGEDTYSLLAWAPRSGFLLYRHQDASKPFYVAVGAVALDNDSLRLLPNDHIDKLRTYAYSNEFRCIRWGGAHYLIPPDAIREFCLAANSTSSRELGRFLFKIGDLARQDTAWPIVPTEYEKYLHIPPISARVVRSREVPKPDLHGSDTILRVTLDAGASRGVEPGMAFWKVDPRSRYRIRLRIVSVSKFRAEADSEEFVYPPDNSSWLPRRGAAFRNRPAKVDCGVDGVAKAANKVNTTVVEPPVVAIGTQPN